jgi:hypothetical protein
MGRYKGLILVNVRLTADSREAFLLADTHITLIIMVLLRVAIVKVHVVRRL